MWPICFAANTLATLPAPTMHNNYIRHTQSGSVKNVRWGRGVHAMDLYSTILAWKWHLPKLLHSCRFPGLQQHLHCSVGDPVATGCDAQDMQYLRDPCMLSSKNKPGLRPSIRNQEIWNEADWGWGWKWWAKMLRYICLSWAHTSVAELPTPKPTQDMRPNFEHVQARQRRSLGLSAGNGVRCFTVTLCLSKISFHHAPVLNPRASL